MEHLIATSGLKLNHMVDPRGSFLGRGGGGGGKNWPNNSFSFPPLELATPGNPDSATVKYSW